jgi:transposase
VPADNTEHIVAAARQRAAATRRRATAALRRMDTHRRRDHLSKPLPAKRVSRGPGSTTNPTLAPRSSGSGPCTASQRPGQSRTGNAPRTPPYYGACKLPPNAASSWRPRTANCGTLSPWHSANNALANCCLAAPATRRTRKVQPSSAPADRQRRRHVHQASPQVSAPQDQIAQDNGRKRHIAVDTCGLLLAVLVTGAHVQDRDAAKPLLWALHTCFPGVRLVWADSGYAGQLVGWASNHLTLTLKIVAKLAGQTTFVVLHRRWAVERTFSWINRCRRTVRDYERLPEHHAAMVQWAMIIIMTRCLARSQHT